MALTEELRIDLRRARADVQALGRELSEALGGDGLDLGIDRTLDDIDRLQLEVRQVGTEVSRVGDQTVEIDVRADSREVDGLVADLNGLRDRTVEVEIQAELSEVDRIEAAIRDIDGAVARVDLDTELGEDRLRVLERQLQGLRNETVRLDIDDSGVDSALADVRQQIARLRDESVVIEVDAETGPMQSALSGLASGGFPARIGGSLGAGIGGALAAAVGLALSAAVESATRTGTSEAAIAVAFGDPETAERLGSVAGAAFNSGLASSVESADEAVLTVLRLEGTDVAEQELADLTAQSVVLAEAFGVSFERQLEVVNSLLRGGLVDSTGEAFDALVTLGQVGSQTLEENAEAVREYAVEWGAAGGEIEPLIGLLSQAGNAFESDKALDGFREFRLQVTSDTDEVRAALEAVGLDAESVFDEVDSGRAASVFGEVLEGIAGVQGVAEQTDIARTLLGTPGEDNLEFFLQYENRLVEVASDAGENAGLALTTNLQSQLDAFGRSVASGDFGGSFSALDQIGELINSPADQIGEFFNLGDTEVEFFPVFEGQPFTPETVAERLGDVLADARAQPVALDVALGDIPDQTLRATAITTSERIAELLRTVDVSDVVLPPVEIPASIGFDDEAIDGEIVRRNVAALAADVRSDFELRLDVVIEADQAAFAVRAAELGQIVGGAFGDPLAPAFDPSTQIDPLAYLDSIADLQTAIADFQGNLLTIEATDILPEEQQDLLLSIIAEAGEEAAPLLAAGFAEAIESGDLDSLQGRLETIIDNTDVSELTEKLIAATDADFPVEISVDDQQVRALATQRLNIPADVAATLDREAIEELLEQAFNIDVVGTLLDVAPPDPAEIIIFPDLQADAIEDQVPTDIEVPVTVTATQESFNQLLAELAADAPAVFVEIQGLLNTDFATGGAINPDTNDAGGDYYRPLLTWVAEAGNPEAIVGPHHRPEVTLGRLDRVGVLDQIRPLLFDDFLVGHPELLAPIAPPIPDVPIPDVAAAITRTDQLVESFNVGGELAAELSSLRAEVARLADAQARTVGPIERIDRHAGLIAGNTSTTASATVDTAAALTRRDRPRLTERGGRWK